VFARIDFSGDTAKGHLAELTGLTHTTASIEAIDRATFGFHILKREDAPAVALPNQGIIARGPFAGTSPELGLQFVGG
jgi:hypothetical protein